MVDELVEIDSTTRDFIGQEVVDQKVQMPLAGFQSVEVARDTTVASPVAHGVASAVPRLEEMPRQSVRTTRSNNCQGHADTRRLSEARTGESLGFCGPCK